MRGLILIAVLLLGACQVRPDRRLYLNGLIGAPEADVVRSMGVPTRTIETEGRRFLAYDEVYSSTVVGGGVGFAYGGWAGPPWGARYGYFGGFPTEIVPRLCETTIEIAGGRMAGYALRGNAC